MFHVILCAAVSNGKAFYIALVFLMILSCKTKSVGYDNNSSNKTESPATISNSEHQVISSCNQILEDSKVNFLSLNHKAITWNDESKILPCWLAEIESGNSILESTLYSRLEERLAAIKYGQFSLISVERINDSIFSRIPTVHMLKIALDYASLDTCISYPGEGPVHFGLVGLNNLKGMFNTSYLKIYSSYYFGIVTENKEIKKYMEDSCEYQSYLYKLLYDLIYKDFVNKKIQLKEIKHYSK